jgi:hypothetical protein
MFQALPSALQVILVAFLSPITAIKQEQIYQTQVTGAVPLPKDS